jgi:hypothetical protein
MLLALTFLAASLATNVPLVNSAFIFVKPHALNDKVLQLVESKLLDAGMEFSKGELAHDVIAEHMLIDSHYGVIAKRAFVMDPADLLVPQKSLPGFARCILHVTIEIKI